jgi:acetyl-CoA C-acetyltransferase
MSIGGTSGQQLVNDAAEAIVAGELDVAVVASAEALATQAAARKRGERREYSHKPAERREFPWEAPPHPQEIAHGLLAALAPFAMFDSARRAHLGLGLDEHRAQLAAMFAPMTRVAAANPDAWFPTERTAADILEPRADNRMTAYPYTKYMVAVMDVDMAAALIVASDDAADRLGVPQDRRVYLRGWCYATDPTYIAEHRALHRSPAMAAASAAALGAAGIGIDDVAHLDLYSCFGSSLTFACDALGIDPLDSRGLTVTGGLPYHGGPGSGYMVHSIAQMARTLRDDPGAFGVTSGVGMINTKHAYGVWSTAAPEREPTPPDTPAIQAALTAAEGTTTIVDVHTGPATVVAATVVHGRDGAAQTGIVVVDVDEHRRAYAKVDDPDDVGALEAVEPVGRTVELTPATFDTPFGEQIGHRARLR